MNKLGNSTADYNKYDAFKVDLNDLYMIAIPYLNSALKIEPENINAAQTLRNIYSAIGDVENYKLMKEKVEKLEKPLLLILAIKLSA